ncbi:MAG: radical SAM protein [Lachnospiraceae bacterium]|nr:radical SAM protein [Lachnospiraceae bacterium]
MRIGLHDAEREYLKKKSFPNYALMKISAWHKARGDTVEWWNPLYRYDRVYSSKVFDFTPVDPYLPEDAVRGGTGYRDIPMDKKLPPEMDDMFPDYSIYPECDYAIGYITRGCPNNCRWCVVPKKEGKIRPYRGWKEIVRQDTDKLVLMDNNILACEYGIKQLESLIGYRIDLNQGMDARLVTEQAADILSRLSWIRFLRFSCDQRAQIAPIRRTVELLMERGVRPYRIFIYLLVTSDLADASERVEALKGYKGINLYAQAERNERMGILPNDMQMEFQQRYVYSGRYRQETWGEYFRRKGLS